MTTANIYNEIQQLAPSAVIELFVLDATNVGGQILRFHAGTNHIRGNIIWQAQHYLAFPIQVSGFELKANGGLPRPKIIIANPNGMITTLLLQTDDLLGAVLTRKRTHAKYLDTANFPKGNVTADPQAAYADDVFFIDRKVNENREFIEFELAAALDLQGVKLPRRQIIQNLCTWHYRGAECGYNGHKYFLVDDTPTKYREQDRCGKRLSSCQQRFGEHAELPYGGFPAAGLIQC